MITEDVELRRCPLDFLDKRDEGRDPDFVLFTLFELFVEFLRDRDKARERERVEIGSSSLGRVVSDCLCSLFVSSWVRDEDSIECREICDCVECVERWELNRVGTGGAFRVPCVSEEIGIELFESELRVDVRLKS